MGTFTELNKKLGHHFSPVDEHCMITLDKPDLLTLIYQLAKAGTALEERLEVLEKERERRIQMELAHLETLMHNIKASNTHLDDMVKSMFGK